MLLAKEEMNTNSHHFATFDIHHCDSVWLGDPFGHVYEVYVELRVISQSSVGAMIR